MLFKLAGGRLEVGNLSISLVANCMSPPGQLVKINPGSRDADVNISIWLCAHSIGSFCSLTCTQPFFP